MFVEKSLKFRIERFCVVEEKNQIIIHWYQFRFSINFKHRICIWCFFCSDHDQKKQVTLTAILDDQGDPQRAMKMWFQPALAELRARHPDLDIKLDYRPIPYLNLHTQLLKTIANQTPVDFITVYQIWLGEFVQKGFLTELTGRIRSWGRQSDWYPASWAAGLYNHKVYGINPYGDIRELVLERSFE